MGYMSGMSDSSWQQTFSRLFEGAVEKYRGLDAEGEKFLGTIGYNAQEFFDFVDDFARGGEPTLQTALEIAAVRRDYFLNEQGGKLTSRRIAMSDLPAKDAELDGIGWLPRLIAKAEAKLRGEMPPDLMYGCGGDRKFFRVNHADPAEFLRQVWKTDGDSKKIVAWIKAQASKS
jgi:hypothetical protein